MIRLLRLLLLCCLSGSTLAQAPATAPLVQTSIVPSEGIVIGQPVRLHVKVLFPGEMTRPPLVKVGEASGAQIMRFETQAITIRDSIDGQAYVGQIFEFVVFPRRGGDIDVPAADVTLLDRKGDPVGATKGQPLRFTVTVPAGIDPSGPVLASTRVRASESWSPDPSTAALKTGGAITRTIQRQAADVPALGMAEFSFAAPDGVRVYVDPPVVDDKVDRGSVEGIRTDKVTYVFEKAGTFALPALSQPWWDLDDRQVHFEALDGLTVTVAAAPGPTPQGWRGMIRDWRGTIAIGSVCLVLLAILVGSRPWLSEMWHRRREHHLNSEAYAWKVLRKAAGTDDAGPTYQALQVWLTRLPVDARRRFEQDARTKAVVGQLERSLFGQGGSWSQRNGAELATLAASLGRSHNTGRTGSSSALPPLNPTTADGDHGA